MECPFRLSSQEYGQDKSATKVNTQCSKCYEVSQCVSMHSANNIRMEHLASRAIIITDKHMHLGLGSRDSGEHTLD